MTCLLDARQGPDLVPSGTGRCRSILACPTWAAAEAAVQSQPRRPTQWPPLASLLPLQPLQPLLHTCAVQDRGHQPQAATEFLWFGW